MRILIASPTYAPLIGGIPTVSELLACGLAGLGEDVTLVTGTPSVVIDRAPFPILRAPTARALSRAVARAEVVLQNTVSLRLGWPLALVHRPLVVAHHMWLAADGASGLLVEAKRLVTRIASNIAVSEAVAGSLGVPATVIGNPYSEALFREEPGAQRQRDLVFVGRLIPEKGLDVALSALAVLRDAGRSPTLTVIGSGPEEARLRHSCASKGLDAQVRFLGPLQGEALAAALNEHRVLLVPSVWEEPFGIVALEGLACGLVPIVSQSGGLPGAVGDCGVVVPKSNATALADAIRWLCDDRLAHARLRDGAAAHLAGHTRARVAARYLEVLRGAVAARL